MSQALAGPPLADLRVIDLTTGPAGGIATMVLADFGAEVLVVKGPTEDPLQQLPAAPMWSRGKHETLLDLDTDRDMATLLNLLAAADIFICNWRPKALKRKGLAVEVLHQRYPHLIICHISSFGSTGPMAEVPGYEHLVAAYSGRMLGFSGLVDRPGPAFSALQVGVHACAQAAVSGILAALIGNEADGSGRIVETSMLRGMLPYEQGLMLADQFRDHFPNLLPPPPPITEQPPMPSLYYHPAQAGDGRWMQFGNLLPHLFDNFLIATDLIDVIADPDFNAKQLLLPTEKHEAFRARMLSKIQERSADEWMQTFIADGGIVATAYQTTQQALNDPDITANGHVLETVDGSKQLGPLARFTQTPAAPGNSIVVDEESRSPFQARWLVDPKPQLKTTSADQQKPPLAGIKVVELATIIAAPMGASMLADLGAEVIKVEQIGGDPYRGMGAGIGSARVNAGKRSISLNLKSEQGKKIVLDLLQDADLLIHNYRPGVPERLGIGYEQLTAVNPDLVYLQANGYGPDGPGALRPSTHPVPGAAMGGVMYQMGERLPDALQDLEGLRLWTRRLMRANEVNPDPNTAMVVTTSALLGLAARQRTGKGQKILVDMFGANAYANHDDFLDYPGKPQRAMPDQQLLGLDPCYRLYPCANQEWVFLALVSERDRKKFTTTANAEGYENVTEQKLRENGQHCVDALEQMFMQRTANEWQQVLTNQGLGCVRADASSPNEFWLNDPQAIETESTSPAQHSVWGNYRRHGAMVTFDRKTVTRGSAPLAGADNESVLADLGYHSAEIKKLRELGVIWQE